MQRYSRIAPIPRPRKPKPSYPRLASAGPAVVLTAGSDELVPTPGGSDPLPQDDSKEGDVDGTDVGSSENCVCAPCDSRPSDAVSTGSNTDSGGSIG